MCVLSPILYSFWLCYKTGDRLKLHILKCYVHYFTSHGNVHGISFSVTSFLIIFCMWRELYHIGCFNFPVVCLLDHQGQKIRTKERSKKEKTDYDDNLGYQDGHVLVIPFHFLQPVQNISPLLFPFSNLFYA